MNVITKVLIASCLASCVAAQEAKVTPLRTQELSGILGKEATMLTVEYPPGGSSAEHRHNAHVFVYVLEGSVVMQVKGGKEVTLGRVKRSMSRLRTSTRSLGMQVQQNPLSSSCSL
jgi:hypothetical protein